MRNLFTLFIFTLIGLSPHIAIALDNNALYQWETDDGTPTYSPDPPPAGVNYVVVDADLNPLPVQPHRPEATAAVTPPATATATLPAPVPKSIPKWQPVRYATDPARAPKDTATAASASAAQSSQITAGLSAISISPECQQLKRETLILESYFAEAETAAEMDLAILKLQEKTSNYRQQCS